MPKIVFHAVVALVFGTLAVVLPDRVFPPDDNYRSISDLGEAFRGFVLGSFRFAMGLFAGLTLVAGLTSPGGGGTRRPVALLLASLFAVAVVGASGFAFRGPTYFPAAASIEDRDHWARRRLGRPYVEAVAWAAASPAVREACGTELRFGPARDARNAVHVGSREWRCTLTLDVEGERGSARLSLTALLPISPGEARPVVGPATLEVRGRTVVLDSAGVAPGS